MSNQERMGSLLLHATAGKCNGGTADLSRTISSYIGSDWTPYDRHSDRVHPKAGLLTLQQIVDYYTRPNGELDFDHFDNLKDIATNCSMNLKQKNHWKPKRVQPARSKSSDGTVEEWKKIVQQQHDQINQQRDQIDQQRDQIKLLTNALTMYLSK